MISFVSDSSIHRPGDPPGLSESDLALIDALHPDVRASWAEVGRRLGVSAPTVRRRWQHLTDHGAAWITSYPGPASTIVMALLEVRCRTGSAAVVAEALGRDRRIVTITGGTGPRDLVLTVFADDLVDLRQLLHESFAEVDEVVEVQTSVATRRYRDGSAWHPRVLPDPPEENRTPTPPVPIEDEQLRRVLAVLEADGRASTEVVARALDSSTGHARRVVARLLRQEQIVQRVDLGLEQDLWPHGLALWMVVPPASLDQAARRIGSLPLTRLCLALAGGAANLYAIVWLRNLAEAAEVEAQIVADTEARVLSRSLVLHYYKRLGHLFDGDRRRIGHLAWASRR